MSANGDFLREGKGGCTLSIKVIPRASQDQVAGVENGELKVRLKAPPVDGAANEALVRFLSRRLGMPKGSFELISGSASRHKVVRIAGARGPEIRVFLVQ